MSAHSDNIDDALLFPPSGMYHGLSPAQERVLQSSLDHYGEALEFETFPFPDDCWRASRPRECCDSSDSGGKAREGCFDDWFTEESMQ